MEKNASTKTIRDHINDILLSADFATWEYSGGGRESHFRNDEALRGVERAKRFERLEYAIRHNTSSFQMLWTIAGRPNDALYTNEVHLHDEAILGINARKLTIYAASINRKITLRYTDTDADMIVRYTNDEYKALEMNGVEHLVPFRNAITIMIQDLKGGV